MEGADNTRDLVEELAHGVIGAAIEVHRVLGPGFIEAMYEEALCVELAIRSIPFARQHPIALKYKGYEVGESRLDLLVGSLLIVELKAVDSLLPIHQAQLMAYLKMTRLKLGLLINFNVRYLKDGLKRIIV